MFNRVGIKSVAKNNFQAQYGISIGAFALFVLISSAAASVSFGLGALLITPPLLVGYASFCLRIYKGERGDISDMFTAGFADYGRSLGGILWMYLFTFLWTLLFFIPGIVKAIAYSMTPYILSDCPKVSSIEALKLSMRMTQGHKGGIFVMYLSFLGWAILSGLTFGILGFLYVGPYFSTSLAGIYVDLKERALAGGIIHAEELA